MVSALDSTLTSSIYSEKETAALFSDEAEINSLIKFEKELAMAQEELGIIPAGIGQKIFSALDGFTGSKKHTKSEYTNALITL